MTASKNLIQAAAGNAGGDFYSYTIDNSARFNDDDDAKLNRTHSTPTSDQKFTYSTWFKHANVTTNAGILFYVRNSAWNRYFAIFAYPPSGTYDGRIAISCNPNGSIQDVYPSALFRDFSAWYHLVLAVDSTESTATDRVKVYINGERVTDWISGTAPNNVTLNQSIAALQSGGITAIGGRDDVANVQKYDGYLSQTAYIDGTAYGATDFGETKNGVWIPKDISGLSFGNNGYYLDYASSSALGNDVSGNNNDLTSSGLTSSDQMTDTPTNNFATLNPLAVTSGTEPTLAEGNLQSTTPVSGGGAAYSTMAIPESGKWYFEMKATAHTGILSVTIGIAEYFSNQYDYVGNNTNAVSYYNTGNKYVDGTGSSYGATWTTNDVIGVAVDADADTVTFYKNNVSQGSISHATSGLFPACSDFSSGYGATTLCNFGQTSFAYTPPTDHLALCTANLPEPTIGPNSATQSDENFNTVLYTGNGTAIGSGGKTISDLDFQPDFTWIKNRDAADNHMLFDAVRGATKYLSSNSTNAEATDTESLTSFTSTGFTLGNNVAVNTNTEDYVAWNWKANGSGSSNTDGTVTSTVSANQDAGFSIVTFTAPASGGFTVGHGLNATPAFVTVKIRDTASYNWYTWHQSFASTTTSYTGLDGTNAVSTGVYTMWPSGVSSTTASFNVGYSTLANSDNVAYIFTEVEGFSKFGSYTGNGSSDGPFVYTGFRPAWLMVKQTNTSGNSWEIRDSSRKPYNDGTRSILRADTTVAEINDPYPIDILSNGFKPRYNGSSVNASGGSYIFMAFAENPFKYSNAR